MTAHLLLITIGPVQDFIAQARRTRDLWFGSTLLSELSRRIAKTLAKAKADLIFPALKEGDDELEECMKPQRGKTGKPPLNISNIILAKVEGEETALRKLAEDVRSEVNRYWAELAGRTKAKCGGLIAPAVDDNIWNEQIASLLEFTAAWTSIENTQDGYKDARTAVVEAVAARKNLRDFEPWRRQRGGANGGAAGVPKSSLDGARETVLREPKDRDPEDVKSYRIGVGEQLDAVGLVKRAGGEPGQFVPLVNVALAPWLNEAERAAAGEFNKLKTACKNVGLARIDRADLPCGQAFTFTHDGRTLALDASVFLENRVWPTFKELGIKADDDSWAKFTPAQTTAWKQCVQKWEKDNIVPLFQTLNGKGIARPFPYVVCLVADGDGMGKAIDKIGKEGDWRKHFEFSKKLAEFAADARRIVQDEHIGSLVFSGGDDVIAFLPVSTALKCANALQAKFCYLMQDACPGFANADRPTLSVGLGVGHVLEGMGDLLALGRAAEKLAKGGHLKKITDRRNALAVILDKRSGGRREFRAKWDAVFAGNPPLSNPADRLIKDAALLRDTLSTRKVFEIDETLRRMPKPGDVAAADQDAWADMLAAEVERSLSRVDAGTGKLDATKVGLDLTGTTYKARYEAVDDWLDRVLIAKAFAEGDPAPRRTPAAPSTRPTAGAPAVQAGGPS